MPDRESSLRDVGIRVSAREGQESLFSIASDLRRQTGSVTADFGAFLLANARRSKAQIFQDLFALYAVGDDPSYFVEIGAGDGETISNTFLLEKEFGWQGIVVEPNPAFLQSLKEKRACIIATDCILGEAGRTIELRCTDVPEFSQIVGDRSDMHDGRRDQASTVITLRSMTLNDLLMRYASPAEIGFLSIDVEGYEPEILASIDFARWSFDVICVEHNFTGARTAILTTLSENGYVRLLENFSQWDDWYVHPRVVRRLEKRGLSLSSLSATPSSAVTRRRRKTASEGNQAQFVIVTPSFNSAATIDEAIASVVFQGGDFVIRYHIQDGGSIDDTLVRLKRWKQFIASTPSLRDRVMFSFASTPDDGMYDAINRGFAALEPFPDQAVMGWIGSSDAFEFGSFAVANDVRRDVPDAQLLTGRITLLNDEGVRQPREAAEFSQRCMAAGLYDGRAMGFVPQESTFWTAVLWRTVGGLDASLRLAGDWDLWRRMAAHQPVFTYDTPVGLHRRHAGQLSEDLSPYHREVDRILAGPAHDLPAVIRDDDLDGRVAGSAATLRDVYRIVREQDGRIRGDPAAFRRSRHVGKALVFNSDLSAWSLLDAVGTVRVPEALVDGTQLRESASVEPVRGFGPSDGPYLQYGLDKPVRWMDGKDAVGRLSVETAGEFEIRLVCRNWIEGQQLSLLVDGSIQSTVSLPVRKHEIDLVVTIRRPFTAGNHELVVRLSRPSPSWQHLLVKSWTAVPIAGAAVSNEP